MKPKFRLLAPLAAMLALIAALSVSGVQAQSNQSFTLAPGGVATITFEAFCSEFGKFFPADGVVEPTGVANDKLRAALAAIQAGGYAADADQALDAQYGFWQVAGSSGVPTGGDIAKAVVTASSSAAPANPSGISVVDAAKANQVKLEVTSWAPIGDKVQILSATDNFYGRGTMTVENISQENLTLFLPVGTLFPATEARFQTMAAYQTKVDAPRLPTTAAGDALPLPLLATAALSLLAAGWLTLRRATVEGTGR